MGLFWLLWSQSALVSLPFLWGLACPTWRHPQPSRCTTAALVRGAGTGSSLSPGARRAGKAAWAVSRVEGTLVRNVGVWCACASAS